MEEQRISEWSSKGKILLSIWIIILVITLCTLIINYFQIFIPDPCYCTILFIPVIVSNVGIILSSTPNLIILDRRRMLYYISNRIEYNVYWIDVISVSNGEKGNYKKRVFLNIKTTYCDCELNDFSDFNEINLKKILQKINEQKKQYNHIKIEDNLGWLQKRQ